MLHVRHEHSHTHNSFIGDSNFSKKITYDIEEDNEDAEWIKREWIRHEESKPLTLEKTVTVDLGDKENPKEAKIGESLLSALLERITDLLKEYQDIFA